MAGIMGIIGLLVFIVVLKYKEEKKWRPEKLKKFVRDEEQAIKDFIRHFVKDNLSPIKEGQEQTTNQLVIDAAAYIGTQMMVLDTVVGLILKHAKSLYNKRLQGSYVDDYGLLVDSAWEREQEYFIDNVILKNQKMVEISLVLLKDFLTVKDALNILLEELFEQLEERCRNFEQKLLINSCLELFESDDSVGHVLKRFYIPGGHLRLSHEGVAEHLNSCAGKKMLYNNGWAICDKAALNMLGLSEHVLYNAINGDKFANMQIAIKENVPQEHLIEVGFSAIATVMSYAIVADNVDLLEDFESEGRGYILHIAQDMQKIRYDLCKILINDILETMNNIAERKTIKHTKVIKPLEYEKEIATRLKKLGFNAHATKGSGDQGADVLADKNGVSFAIQCKMYSNPVGNKAVQEANTARDFYKCDYAAVITSAGYTKSARQAANACNVILLNESEISKLNEYTECTNNKI